MRGFVKANHGSADEQRAARYILKDMVNGKLLYCQPPPNISPSKFNHEAFKEQIRKYSLLRSHAAKQQQKQQPASSSASTSVPQKKVGASAEAIDDDDLDIDNTSGPSTKKFRNVSGPTVLCLFLIRLVLTVTTGGGGGGGGGGARPARRGGGRARGGPGRAG